MEDQDLKQPKVATQDKELKDQSRVINKPNQTDDTQAWDKVDSLFTVARNAFFQGNSTFLEVLESLIATLQEMREDETRPLGGLGAQKRSMNLDEPKQEDEKVPVNPNI